MSKVHQARPSSKPPGNSKSTTPAPATGATGPLRIDGHSIEQQVLARESNVSKSLVSRMFSTKGRQGRKDPKLSTMLGLQRGLRKITGKEYSLDFIGELIRA